MSRPLFHSGPPKAADNAEPPSESFHADEIKSQLHRIVGSDHFRGSLRLTRFLTFVVETALAGKADRIKAYTIAVEALGRGPDFDPQNDPIVRVEAGRLRQALSRYYAKQGRGDGIIVDLPRGTYVPAFEAGRPSRQHKPPAMTVRSLPQMLQLRRRPQRSRSAAPTTSPATYTAISNCCTPNKESK